MISIHSWRLLGGFAAVVLTAATIAALLSGAWIAAGMVALIALLGAVYMLAKAERPAANLRELLQRWHGEGRAVAQTNGPEGLSRAVDNLLTSAQSALAAKENERRELSAILEGMAEGVVAVDSQERLVHINAAAASLLRIDRQAALGHPVWEITRAMALIESLRAALAGQPEQPRELLLSDGAERYLDLRASALHGGDGRLSGAVVVLHDVTQLRRLEQVRRDFVTNVGHELKTPLAAIQALVETVLDDSEMEPFTRQRFLERTISQAQRLKLLVNDLLLLSRVESQDAPYEHSVLDLRQPVRASLSALATAAEAKRIRLELRENGQATVSASHELLQQAVGNLIDNAIKYSPEGGAVSVECGIEADRAIVRVSDGGVGIPLHDQSRIFERFYRVDKARSREVGGTGLGLAIVKHIMLAHKGSVTVSSKLGKGSTFTIEMPLVRTAVIV